MMIKRKKFFGISLFFVSSFLLGNIFILSSCASNGLSKINPPENTPSIPSVTPPVIPPTVPNTPEELPPEQMTVINNNSLTIKGNKSDILPSMLLTNNKENIDISKFNKYYNEELFKDIEYKLISLDDWVGSISFEMTYRIIKSNTVKTHKFNFSGLMKMQDIDNFNISFQTVDTFLNAYEYSKNTFNISDFLNKLFNEKPYFLINNKKFLLSYLDFSKNISNNFECYGWNDSWFNTANKLTLRYVIKNLTISYYQKSDTDSNVIKKEKSISNNKIDALIVNFYSGLDYLLNNIIVNSSYRENMLNEYYWGDFDYNNGVKVYQNLVNNKWINNFSETLPGTNLKYKIILSADEKGKMIFVDERTGDLIVNIKTTISDNSNIVSTNIKRLHISNIEKIGNNPFHYDDQSVNNNKFKISLKNESFSSFMNELRLRRLQISHKIENGRNNEIKFTTNDLGNELPKLNELVIKNMKVMFNNQELSEKNLPNKKYFSNSDIYVKGITFEKEKFEYSYNKTKDVFQVLLKAKLSLSRPYYSNILKINITNSNALAELKKQN